MLKLVWLSEVPVLTADEIAASLAQKKGIYRDMLNAVTDSENIRRRAKKIAARDNSCLQCVFNSGDYSCRVPYSDAYMEDLKINPCYEGVLKYLTK